MQIELKIGYNVFVGEMSGAELEIMNRIFDRLHCVDTHHLDNQTVFVPMETQPEVLMKVIRFQVPTITQEEYASRKVAIDRADRAKQVAAIMKAIETDGYTAKWKSLLTTIYCEGMINRAQHEYMKETSGPEVGMNGNVSFHFMDDGLVVNVTPQGDVEKFQ